MDNPFSDRMCIKNQFEHAKQFPGLKARYLSLIILNVPDMSRGMSGTYIIDVSESKLILYVVILFSIYT